MPSDTLFLVLSLDREIELPKNYWKAVVYAIAMLLVFGMVAHVESVNHKEYGNCTVLTSVDEFTDDEMDHILLCFSGGLLGLLMEGPGLALRWYEEGGTTVSFRTGDLVFLENLSSVSVVFRIDKGVVREGKWHWNSDGMSAVTHDQMIFDLLLKELPSGKRIVFKIGDEKGIVALDGSARAIRDFRSRIQE